MLKKTFESIKRCVKTCSVAAKMWTKKGSVCEEGGRPDPPLRITFSKAFIRESSWMSLSPFSKPLTKQTHPFCPRKNTPRPPRPPPACLEMFCL